MTPSLCGSVNGRRGLTLLELVVVIAILAIVATLILPKLDFLSDQAEHATAASIQADLGTVLRAHKVATGQFPCLDLLIDTNNAVYTGPEGSSTVAGGVWGEAASSGFQRLVVPVTVPAECATSLAEGRLLEGYRHLPAATDATNSTGTPPTDLPLDLVTTASGGNLVLAQLNPDSPSGVKIVYTLYPKDGVVPSNTRLVLMGIGGRNTMVGSTMQSTPIDRQNDDPTKIYCRFLAVFSVYDNGHPAQLALVVDHRGQQIYQRLDLYEAHAPVAE